jgi:hypothetical protein
MFSEVELASITEQIDAFCDERVPIAMRDRIVLQYRIHRHDILLFRKLLSSRRGGEWVEIPVVKLRYNRTRGEWSLLYRDHRLRWRRYPNLDPVPSLSALLEEINADPLAVFWE